MFTHALLHWWKCQCDDKRHIIILKLVGNSSDLMDFLKWSEGFLDHVLHVEGLSRTSIENKWHAPSFVDISSILIWKCNSLVWKVPLGIVLFFHSKMSHLFLQKNFMSFLEKYSFVCGCVYVVCMCIICEHVCEHTCVRVYVNLCVYVGARSWN